MTTDRIWTDFNDQLRGFIRKRVNDSQTVDDILQEVFVKVHLKQGELKDLQKLGPWLYAITRNQIIDHFRKKKNTNLDHEQLGISDEEVENLNDRLLCCLKRFVMDLPEKFHAVLLETEFGSTSQKAFAEKHGINYSSLKSRVQRGKMKLKERFVESCGVQSDKYGNVIDLADDHCDCPSEE